MSTQTSRIALVGNMNNNFFAICRYLRDYGYDATLFLLDEYGHFLPSNDTFDEEYQSYTIQTDWHKYNFFDDKLKAQLKKDLDGYDFIIGCHIVPSYLKLIGRQLDIFIPYGGDLVYHTSNNIAFSVFKLAYRFFKGLRPVNPYTERARLQREGIIEAGIVIADFFSHSTEKIIAERLSGINRVQASMPMVYDSFSKAPGKAYAICSEREDIQRVLALKQQGYLLFTSPVRQNWVGTSNINPSKGNDITLRAFAKYLSFNKKAALVLFEYGKDVEATKALIRELGIEENVVWVKQMDRKYILFMLNSIDLSIGNIATAYLTYGVILEAFLMKVPFVHTYHDIRSQSKYNYLYDTYHASNEEELLAVMKQIKPVKDAEVNKMVDDCYNWYFREIVENFINIINSRLAKKEVQTHASV